MRTTFSILRPRCPGTAPPPAITGSLGPVAGRLPSTIPTAFPDFPEKDDAQDPAPARRPLTQHPGALAAEAGAQKIAAEAGQKIAASPSKTAPKILYELTRSRRGERPAGRLGERW